MGHEFEQIVFEVFSRSQRIIAPAAMDLAHPIGHFFVLHHLLGCFVIGVGGSLVKGPCQLLGQFKRAVVANFVFPAVGQATAVNHHGFQMRRMYDGRAGCGMSGIGSSIHANLAICVGLLREPFDGIPGIVAEANIFHQHAF